MAATKLTLSDIFPSGDFSDSAYKPEKKAHVVSQGNGAGVLSIFNNYSLFRYSKYGPGMADYNPEMHASGKQTTAKVNGPRTEAESLADKKQFTGGGPTFQDLVSNPDAGTIIKHFSEFKGTTEDAMGPTPYAWTDFLWCKYYGFIPNNRLITLRRYPIPVNDSIKTSAADNKVLVPVAQAVTWFGEETGNTLSSIIPNKLTIAWKDIAVSEQVVEGNEITIKSLFEILGQKAAQGIMPAITTLLNKGEYKDSLSNVQQWANEAPKNDGATSTLANTAYYDKMRDYFNQLYTNGAYWDQIFGPVSVINHTMIRDRGLSKDSYQQEIKLNFHYNLRSYGNIRPKIAFLDLLANFLELTYMNGQFLNMLERYVGPAGSAIIDPHINAMISSAISSGNLGEVTMAYQQVLAAMVKGIGSSIPSYAQDITAAGNGNPSAIAKDAGDLGKNYLALFFGQAMRPLIERSALNYRPIGEWHLVIGNPLNPIATLGDLICKSVDITLGDELGPDDFPTEVTFTVVLQMSKPRDSFGYQSMFNLGNGSMYVNSLRAPSSKSNTYDSSNNPNGKSNGVGAKNADASGSELQGEITDTKGRIAKNYGTGYATDFIDSYFAKDSNEKNNQQTGSGFSVNKTATSK